MKKGLVEVDLAFVTLRVCSDLVHAEGLKEVEAFKAYKTAEWLGKLPVETGELGQVCCPPASDIQLQDLQETWDNLNYFWATFQLSAKKMAIVSTEESTALEDVEADTSSPPIPLDMVTQRLKRSVLVMRKDLVQKS